MCSNAYLHPTLHKTAPNENHGNGNGLGSDLGMTLKFVFKLEDVDF